MDTVTWLEWNDETGTYDEIEVTPEEWARRAEESTPVIK